MPLPNQDKWDTLFNICDKVDIALKSSELLALEVSIPVINQLRYVECHVRRVLRSNNHDNLKQLEKAVSHAKRAYFDAQEIIASTILEDLKNIRKVVGKHSRVLHKHIDSYPKLRDTMLEAEAQITDIISESKSRDDMYDNLDKHIQPIQIYITAFKKAQEDILSDIGAAKLKLLVALTGISATIIGALIGIILAVC